MADSDEKLDSLVRIPDRTPAPLGRLGERTLAAFAELSLCSECGHAAEEHRGATGLGACQHATLVTRALAITHWCECAAFVRGAETKRDAKLEAEVDYSSLEVVPLSLGLETAYQVAVRLIERGAVLPVSASWILLTSVDKQQEIAVRVFQGEVGDPDLRRTLAMLVVAGLPPAPRRMAVTLSIRVDENGLVSFTARTPTKGSLDVNVTTTVMLSQTEVEQLVRKAKLSGTRPGDD